MGAFAALSLQNKNLRFIRAWMKAMLRNKQSCLFRLMSDSTKPTTYAFNPQNNPLKWSLLLPSFSIWQNWDSEKLSKVTSGTQLKQLARTQTQICLTASVFLKAVLALLCHASLSDPLGGDKERHAYTVSYLFVDRRVKLQRSSGCSKRELTFLDLYLPCARPCHVIDMHYLI